MVPKRGNTNLCFNVSSQVWKLWPYLIYSVNTHKTNINNQDSYLLSSVFQKLLQMIRPLWVSCKGSVMHWLWKNAGQEVLLTNNSENSTPHIPSLLFLQYKVERKPKTNITLQLQVQVIYLHTNKDAPFVFPIILF